MVEIRVDNLESKDQCNFIYHHQKEPRPGGHKYLIRIKRTERSYIFLKNIYGSEISEDAFIKKIRKSFHNHFNPIIQLQDFNNCWPNKRENIKWVFNNIESVDLDEINLVIRGTASKFIKDFV